MTSALTFPQRLSTRNYVLIALALVALQAAILLAMGRVPICTCGTIKLWQSTVNSSENSQHIFDWYTPSHVIHGILFYFALWLIFPKAPVLTRLLLAIGIEAAWEIAENTPFVIERYRSGTISLSYNGDSIVNSVSDTFAMAFGFLLAAKLPVLVSASLIVIFEVTVAYFVRDNLALNVLMLLHPLDQIREWQAALPNR